MKFRHILSFLLFIAFILLLPCHGKISTTKQVDIENHKDFTSNQTSRSVLVELFATYKTLESSESPDGVGREIITINDMFPGPTIYGRIGDTITIRFHNFLKDSKGTKHATSVHFHGMEMKLSPWFDGPEMVTQCPVPYGRYMDYTFTIHQSGTYWYHSHHQWQYIDGFWGWLVIENEQDEKSNTIRDVHPYDDEMMISVTDWHWKTGEELTEEHNNAKEPGSPTPNSALINGRGNADCVTAEMAGHKCNPPRANRATVFNAIHGWTYRLRLLNPSAKAVFNFSIDGHKMRVIEMDGVDTTLSRPVDVITLWPAQRYSVLIKMVADFSTLGDNYWIRTDMFVNGVAKPDVNPKAVIHHLFEKSVKPPCKSVGQEETNRVFERMKLEKRQSVGGGRQGRPCENVMPWEDKIVLKSSAATNSRTVLLGDSDKSEMIVESSKCLSRVQSQRHHQPVLLDQEWCNPVVVRDDGSHDVEETPVLTDETQVFTLNATIPFPHKDWLINGRPYATGQQSVPAIFRIMKKQNVPHQFRPLRLDLGKTVQIVINNMNPVPHPYHLHGHTYFVLGTGNEGDGPFNSGNKKHIEKISGSSIRRDTTHTPPNSWSVVRIITNNPGVWILHCHIHWHLDHGLAAVFVEGEWAQQEIYKIPDEARRVCRMSGISIPN